MPNLKKMLKNAKDIAVYIAQGIAEDITYNKRVKGIGKWNDVIKKKKGEPLPTTPERFALSPLRAIDIKRRVMETHQATKQ